MDFCADVIDYMNDPENALGVQVGRANSFISVFGDDRNIAVQMQHIYEERIALEEIIEKCLEKSDVNLDTFLNNELKYYTCRGEEGLVKCIDKKTLENLLCLSINYKQKIQDYKQKIQDYKEEEKQQTIISLYATIMTLVSFIFCVLYYISYVG